MNHTGVRVGVRPATASRNGARVSRRRAGEGVIMPPIVPEPVGARPTGVRYTATGRAARLDIPSMTREAASIATVAPSGWSTPVRAPTTATAL